MHAGSKMAKCEKANIPPIVLASLKCVVFDVVTIGPAVQFGVCGALLQVNWVVRCLQ